MAPATISPIHQTPEKHLRVLLILDAQVGHLSEPPTGVPTAQAVKANIERILLAARGAPNPPLIVHVRNCGDTGEPDELHTPGWELMWRALPGEPVLDKHKNNAFSGTPLAEYVADDAEIVVVGVQSDFSVRATCSAALGRGNAVLLIRGAHATYDRHEVWAGGGITPAGTIEREIESELEEAGVALLDMTDVPGVFSDR